MKVKVELTMEDKKRYANVNIMSIGWRGDLEGVRGM